MWEPGAPEPETSIKIAQRLAKLVAATDHSASICFYFVVHWAREYVGAGSSTSGA